MSSSGKSACDEKYVLMLMFNVVKVAFEKQKRTFSKRMGEGKREKPIRR